MVTLNLTAPGATLFPYTTLFRSSVAEDGTLSFPASDLTGNDSAGPANESGQTLKIGRAAWREGATNGAVVLAAGKVTYTPAADYNGAASFQYTVRDNGQTAGVNDFKSATGTVNVTVTEGNDASTAVDDAKSVAEDGTLSFPASDLTGNDSAGPANESGQTLTVATAHVCTAVTDGTGMPASGQNNNTPAAVYNGAASFDYTVHHDGQMPGVNH